MLRVVTLLLRARVYEQSQPAQARGLRSMAGQIHRRFQESRSTPELLARTGLPPFERFQALLESPPES
jgi:hypothetical protein